MSLTDPCLFTKDTEMGMIIVGLYVDDNLWVGPKQAILREIEELRKEDLEISVADNLRDYLGCKITLSDDKRRGCITQPSMIDKLKEKFGEIVGKLPVYRTPGTPGFKVIRKDPEKEPIDDNEAQSTYRTGVGMLLYMVKHSRPDIANSVRELSKVLGCCNMGDFKEMKRVIKYVLDTPTKGLKIEPEVTQGNWKLEIFSDSDFSGDKETRLSVSGFILYVCGVPISWRSKQQRSVALSSSEAEWYACSEAVKEILYVAQLLETFKVKIQQPLIVRVDNIGVIYMSEQDGVTSKTKHISTRTFFVKSLCKEKKIKIVFVRGEDNDSDVFTKNVSGEIKERHESKYMIDELGLNGDKMGRMLKDTFKPIQSRELMTREDPKITDEGQTRSPNCEHFEVTKNMNHITLKGCSSTNLMTADSAKLVMASTSGSRPGDTRNKEAEVASADVRLGAILANGDG